MREFNLDNTEKCLGKRPHAPVENAESFTSPGGFKSQCAGASGYCLVLCVTLCSFNTEATVGAGYYYDACVLAYSLILQRGIRTLMA